MTWDFIEGVTTSTFSGGFERSIEWVSKAVILLTEGLASASSPDIVCADSTLPINGIYDAIVTDPPYYDAIPYADLSDFFYVWLRRVLDGYYDSVMDAPLTPKAAELVQQTKSGTVGREGKRNYEYGMKRAFDRSWLSLVDDGYLVVVFAHKEPDAWESLVSALIQAGFRVTASWPIDTEREVRSRSINAAALASSIWLVCQKRSSDSGIGRYRAVRRAMEERVTERLRYFWDIGLSGPDFVWAAVGPALESYSSFSEVKRLDGSTFTVSDFLKEVRRMVADFALGQILKGKSTEGLDEWTRYYLIHRSNFGLANAPVGECILMTQGYGLDLNELRSERGYIRKGASKSEDQGSSSGSSSSVRLAKWDERTRDDLGQPHPSGGLPMIDALHHLMHLWATGNLDRLNQYIAEQGLRQNELFWAVAQAILEMAEPKSRERTLLEVIVAWGRGKVPEVVPQQEPLLPTDMLP